jgi:hypothetical protein
MPRVPLPEELEAEVGNVVDTSGAPCAQAPQQIVRDEARQLYEVAIKNGGTGPNKVEATKQIRKQLQEKGYKAQWRLINPILDEDEFKNLRQPVGKTHRSKCR